MLSQGLPRSRRLHLKNDFKNVIQTGRKIQGWSQEKLYVFGLQVYKRYAAFCGGQRFILGLPAGRVLTGRQPKPKGIKN